ncbi:MAG: hypothetical protein GY757_61840 [bacterium]|nr:hypothetical protein [bacterium]
MKRLIVSSFLVITLLGVMVYAAPGTGEPADSTHKYFGCTPPGNTPKTFAPGVITSAAHEHSRLAISPAGDEMFWAVQPVPFGSDFQKIWHTKLQEDKWSKPAVAPFSGKYYDGNPAFSVDGKKLYFYSKRPETGKGDPLEKDLYWMIERKGNGWGPPRLQEKFIETGNNTMSFCFNSKGDLYYDDGGPSENDEWTWSIYYSKKAGNGYAAPVNLSKALDTKGLDWCPYIAPDDSYLIFSSHSRKDSFGNGDLYISFRQNDGTRGKPKHMGNRINTAAQERFPAISPCGKYFFFARHVKKTYSDFFWVSSSIIDYLKKHDLNIIENLSKVSLEKGIKALEQTFHQLKAKHGTFYDFTDSVLIDTAMQLVRSDQAQRASEIIALNMKLFPGSRTGFQAYLVVLLEENDESYKAHMVKIKEKRKGAGDITEAEVNTLGYRLLELKKFTLALRVFRLNVELHPASANVYDNLGDGCYMSGNKDGALLNYKKSLELSPGNQAVIRKIEFLEKK